MTAAADTQSYDGSVKTIFKNDAANILPHLLPGAVWQETLDIEILRAPMRVDRAFLVLRNGKLRIVHLEFQASTDMNMAHRLLIYHANIWNDHKCPVITIVIYLFKSSVPESPLKECDDEEILTFHFRVITLWTEDMEYYTKNKIISMYPLLPAMKYTDTGILLEAINEMVEYYEGDETVLAQQLLRFRTFLDRTDTVPIEEKKKVEERLDIFDQLLEQSQYVLKQRALAKEEGKEEGQVLALRSVLVDIVCLRYPSLKELAQQRASHLQDTGGLREIINLLATVPDEATARFILSGSSTLPIQH